MQRIEHEQTFDDLKNELPERLREVAALMEDSVRQNFFYGGRPSAWKPVKSGETPLVLSGKLFRSIKGTSGENWAEVSTTGGLPYARIHQYGGFTHPTVTEKSKKFFWAMFFETGDPKWKYMALQKPGTKMSVKIDARPYMVLQVEDLEKIKSIIRRSFTLTGG